MTIHGKSMISLAAAAVALLFLVSDQAVGQQATSTSPSIVFVGTVDAVGAVTLPNLAVSPNTSVVAVERVVRKPEAIALDPGDKVTVVTEGVAPVQKGVRALFLTDGWIFGTSLAVRVVSWEPVAAASPTAVAAQDTKVMAEMQAAADKGVKAAIANADIIVVGRVTKVQPPSVAALAPSRQLISEHNPDWQEAVINVQSTLKGSPDMKEVVVRFPASRDVMWAGYPKFKEGQEGTFLLQRDRVSAAPTAMLNSKSVNAYVATSPNDVLSSADAAKIKSLIGR